MKKKTNSKLFWALQVLGWTVYALSMYFLFSKSKPDDYVSKALFLYSYVLGFLMTSFILRYFYRFLRRKIKSIRWLLAAVFLTILIIVPLWYFIDVFSSMLFWESSGITSFFKKISIRMYLQNNFMIYVIYCGWTALYFSIKYRIEWQEEKKRSEEAFHLAQKAQFQMLRYQLNPHFLFNSLNSIKALVEEDKASAKQMITELSDFLRYSLKDKDIAFRPLKEELDALKLYLSIEKKRFEEKIQISYDIPDETINKQILNFLIHPIIENAIKYGMKTSKLPLEINIKSYMENDFLAIEICNSGKWLEWGEAEGRHGTGTGLENVKKRLENTYLNDYRFEISKGENRVCVKITMKTNE
jgi:two-component system, LytTR family, sensor kinase